METAIQIAPDFFLEDPESTFHALKYNVKPESIAATAGKLVIQDPSIDSAGQVSAQFQSNTSETVYYAGTQQTGKDLECVLLWDDESQTYFLHRLASTTKLTRNKKAPPLPKISVSNVPSRRSPVPETAHVPSPQTQASPKPVVAPPSPVVRPILSAVTTTNPPRALPSPSFGTSFVLQQQQQQQQQRAMTGAKTLPKKPMASTGLYSSSSSEDSDAESSSGSDFDDLANAMSQAAS